MRATALPLSTRRALGSVEAFSSLDVLDQKSFLRILHIEQKRAERSRRPFALMLVQFGSSFPEASKKQITDQTIFTLSKTLRETDIIGWHESSTIGIIFTELGLAEKSAIVSALVTKVKKVLASVVREQEIHNVSTLLYIFPEDYGPESGDRASGASTPTGCVPDEVSKTVSLRIKRVMDIFGSLLTLLCLTPLLITLALVIKLTSRGPILYRQDRVGLYGRKFVFLKFRSMYFVDNHAIHEEFVKRLIVSDNTIDQQSSTQKKNVYKIKNDPRVTKVGRFLRRTSLDELPQFLNVLRGEMALVGPRPPIPYEVKYYDIWHKRRLLTKPGITGLWQVTGRSRVGFDDMVRLDLKYATSWSLWLDIKILLKTPGAVLGGEGAY